jgi:lipoate-protein ligase A
MPPFLNLPLPCPQSHPLLPFCAMSGRLIIHGAREPLENMAIDAALLLACEEGATGFPALRFYWWTIPTLSLGAKERLADAADIEECHRRGIALVRRPTGGRAVLHDNELTYSIVGTLGKPPFNGSVTASYGHISRAMLEGLSALGIKLDLAPPERRRAGAHMPCFAAPSRFELAAGGRKLVGSAQRRVRRAVLQHGSILIRSDPRTLAAVSGLDAPRAEILADSMVGLEQLLDKPISRNQIIDALLPPLENLLGALTPGDLTGGEQWICDDLLAQGRFEVVTGHEAAAS